MIRRRASRPIVSLGRFRRGSRRAARSTRQPAAAVRRQAGVLALDAAHRLVDAVEPLRRPAAPGGRHPPHPAHARNAARDERRRGALAHVLGALAPLRRAVVAHQGGRRGGRLLAARPAAHAPLVARRQARAAHCRKHRLRRGRDRLHAAHHRGTVGRDPTRLTFRDGERGAPARARRGVASSSPFHHRSESNETDALHERRRALPRRTPPPARDRSSRRARCRACAS